MIAGIAGLKSLAITPKNPSARLLRDWIEENTFIWLVSEEILSEYKRVMAALGVRRSVIGRLINLLREEAEPVRLSMVPGVSPDPGDDYFCACAENGKADFIVTLNIKDFPQRRLSAHVIKPGETIPTTARRRIRRKE